MIPKGKKKRKRSEEHFETKSFWGRFEDHFRVGDHFGVGIISGAVQNLTSKESSGINLWSFNVDPSRVCECSSAVSITRYKKTTTTTKQNHFVKKENKIIDKVKHDA